MKRQETAAWLEECRQAEAAMERLGEDLSRWQARGRQVAAGTETAQRPGDGRKNQREKTESGQRKCLERVGALQKKMREEMEELKELREECRRAIAALEPDAQRQVMRLRYLEGLTLEKAAEKLNYSVRQAGRLHAAGLRALCAGRKGGEGARAG